MRRGENSLGTERKGLEEKTDKNCFRALPVVVQPARKRAGIRGKGKNDSMSLPWTNGGWEGTPNKCASGGARKGVATSGGVEGYAAKSTRGWKRGGKRVFRAK